MSVWYIYKQQHGHLYTDQKVEVTSPRGQFKLYAKPISSESLVDQASFEHEKLSFLRTKPVGNDSLTLYYIDGAGVGSPPHTSADRRKNRSQ